MISLRGVAAAAVFSLAAAAPVTAANACGGQLPVTAIQASTNDGNVANNAIDGNFQTRWSGYGIGANLTADIGSLETVCSVNIAWYQGDTRQNYFVISVSADATNFRQVYSGTSSGTTAGFESYALTATQARYVRITVNGNSVNEWASITELKLSGAISVYDETILADGPVLYLPLNPNGQSEPDLSGHGNTGTYIGGTSGRATMPNGDDASTFNGVSEYVTVESSNSLSIPTTGNLTWEAWIDPAVLQFPTSSSDGLIAWMGKCANYSPTCEWQARLYNRKNPQGRCNRLSAYVFNQTAGLGSGADWQPVCGLIHAGEWLHVVGEYTTETQPSTCPNASEFPGSINIWVNGVKWDQAFSNPTGCMSQFSVTPKSGSSPLNVGTMAYDTFFEGAIGKLAIYDYRLSQAQISNHYTAMSGKKPTGSCTDTCSF